MKKYLVLCVSAIMLTACVGHNRLECAEHEKNAKAPVYFKFNSTVPTTASKARMQDGLIYLTGHRFRKIQLDGWADAQGGNTWYNMDLSRRRAETVRDFMVAGGVAEKRITVDWHGVQQGMPYKMFRRVDVTIK